MTYGHSPRAFIEDGPEAQALQVRASHSTARSWFALEPDLRLELVEQALRSPANDMIDDYPLAL